MGRPKPAGLIRALRRVPPSHQHAAHENRRQWLTVTRSRVGARVYHQCERCRKPLHAWIFTYTWKSRDPQFSGALALPHDLDQGARRERDRMAGPDRRPGPPYVRKVHLSYFYEIIMLQYFRQ